MAIKLIGADLSGSAPAAKLPQVNPAVNELTPTNGFQFAGQQLQQAGQGMQSSISNQAKMTAAMAQDNAQTTETIRSSQQTQIQANAARGADNLRGLADVGNMIVKTLDDVGKRKAAQRKAEQDFNAAQLTEKLARFKLTSIEEARTNPSGLTGLTTVLDGMLNGADISQEDQTKLFQDGYGHLSSIQTKNIEDRVSSAAKIRATMDETTVTQISIMNVDFIGELKRAPDADKRADIVNRLVASNKPLFAGQLSPNATALASSALYKSIYTAMQEATDKEGELYKSLTNMQEYAVAMEKANRELADSPLELKRLKGMLEFKHSIKGDFGQYYDLNAGEKIAEEQGKLELSLQGIQAEFDTTAANAAPNSPLELGAIINALPTEGDLEVFLTNPANTKYVVNGKETNHGKSLRKAFAEIRGTSKDETRLQKEIADIGVQKTDLGIAAVQANISYIKALKPKDVSGDNGAGLRALIQGLPGMDANRYNSIVQSAGTAPTDPAAFAQWQDKLGELIGDHQKALQAKGDALDQTAILRINEQSGLKRTRASYGFIDDGKGRTSFDTQSYTKYIDARNAEAARRQPVPGVAGTPAPFSRVAMATMTSPISGKQVFIPFKKGTESQGTSRFGPREAPVPGASTYHGGTDIWAKTGTPIISAMRGTVSYNGDYGGGGNGVEIKYEDGTTHTYMHLNVRSPLSVGQPIVAGQVVGQVGATGNVSGEHLHWEVKNKQGDRIDPFIWAETYSNTPQRGSTATKQVHRSKETSFATRRNPPNTTPIFGGYIQGTGKNVKVVMYDAQRPDVAAARAATPQPSRVDPSKGNRVLMQRTGQKDANGLENIMVTMYDKSGGSIGQYMVNSGSPTMQGMFGKGNTTKAGSNAPLEFGEYNIEGTYDRNDHPGMRSRFIYIEPKFTTQRGELGIHFDGNRAVAPGSAGCVVFGTKAKFNEFHDKLRKSGINTLEFSPVKYTAANPVRTTSDSRRPSKGGLDADHGYKALRDQPVFRNALNATAQRLGMNPQWLADAMAGESGFSTSIRERTGRPAVGLIQFYQDRATPGFKTVNGTKYSLQQIGKMGQIEQLKLVENYFTEAFRNAGGRAKSPEDVLGLIWANQLDKDIELGRHDGNITWGEYRKTLGNRVGRTYSSAPPRAANNHIASTQSSDRSSRITQQIDNRPRSGCLSCSQMVASNQFVPHERVNTLNKGSELFTYNTA